MLAVVRSRFEGKNICPFDARCPLRSHYVASSFEHTCSRGRTLSSENHPGKHHRSISARPEMWIFSTDRSGAFRKSYITEETAVSGVPQLSGVMVSDEEKLNR